MSEETQDIQEVEQVTNPELEAIKAELERVTAHNQKLVDERKEHDEVARRIKADKLIAEQEAARKSGDYEALEKSYKERDAVRQAELDELYRQRDSSSVEQASQKLVSQLADNPTNQRLLQRFVKDRLKVIDGQLRVVDDAGQLSAHTLDDLANEFKSSGMYDSLISGTKGSGTGGNGKGSNLNKSPTDYSEAERAALLKTNPEQFRQLFNS